ncbi:MAG: helix-turn-helix domain-containing protein [Streptosporangiaceae bacterium]
MASVPGRVFSRYELVNRARGYEYEGYERTIDSHIRNLRRKIGADPRAPGLIDTVTGTGYRLAITCDRAPAQPPAAGQDQAAAPGRGRCLPPGTSVLPGSALRRWGSAIYRPTVLTAAEWPDWREKH